MHRQVLRVLYNLLLLPSFDRTEICTSLFVDDICVDVGDL